MRVNNELITNHWTSVILVTPYEIYSFKTDKTKIIVEV